MRIQYEKNFPALDCPYMMTNIQFDLKSHFKPKGKTEIQHIKNAQNPKFVRPFTCSYLTGSYFLCQFCLYHYRGSKKEAKLVGVSDFIQFQDLISEFSLIKEVDILKYEPQTPPTKCCKKDKYKFEYTNQFNLRLYCKQKFREMILQLRENIWS